MGAEKKEGLAGDPARRASDAVHGFISQFWHTVHAWLDLPSGDILFVEGAEDFDVVSGQSATATQVKATSANITLRSADVVETVKNFWNTRQKNRDHRIYYRFLSTSEKGQERGAPFGPGVSGLGIWERSIRDPSLVEVLRAFLIDEKCFDGDLKSFIESATTSELAEELISRITWDVGASDSTGVQEAVKRKLIDFGVTRHVPAPDAERVASRLLREVADAAGSKERRALQYADFVQIFDEETRISVPIAQHQASVAAIISLLSGSLSSTSLTLDLRTATQRKPPPLPKIYAPRTAVVQQAQLQLTHSHIVSFQGSTGKGKTILAALVVQSRSDLVWAPFRGLTPRETNSGLRQLGHVIDENRSLKTIVLDDLDFDPTATRDYEAVLGGLLYTILARGGEVIATSERVFPPSIWRGMGLSKDPTIAVPSLARTEIESFALSLGCPADKTKHWASVVEMKSEGHPQLVHAQLLTLSRQGWPDVDMNAVIEIPKEIAAERARARMLLAELPEEEKRLLYYLSLISGPFRRDHAIAIAEMPPAAGIPGDIFDHLLGPWIEPVSPNYFRLSPLLANAATEVWSADKVNGYREQVGLALLQCGKLTTAEANQILMLGFVSRSRPLLFAMSSNILARNLPLQEPMAQSLFWLTALVTDRPVFPEQLQINWMLRALQFHVAAALADKNINAIANRLDIETTSQFLGGNYEIGRLLSLLSVVLAFQARFSPKMLLHFIDEIDLVYLRLAAGDDDLARGVREIKASLSRVIHSEAGLAAVLFGFVSIRCDGSEYLSATLAELRNNRSKLIDHFREFFAADDMQARMLVDRAWIGDEKREPQNWNRCIEVMQEGVEFAKEFDVPNLADAAVRAMVIVCDEYLNDRPRAFQILEKIGASLSSHSNVYVDAHANLLVSDGRNADALKLWDSILPDWQVHPVSLDSSVVFAHRKAGMASVGLEEFERASQYFLTGVAKADAAGLTAIAAGLLADAAFSKWRGGDFDYAISVFVDVLKRLEILPNSKEDIPSFRVRKIVGQMLIHIEHSAAGVQKEGAYAPPPGAGSNPEAGEKWLELPVTSPEQLWLLLAQTEAALHLEPRAFTELRTRIGGSTLPTVRWFGAELEVKHAIRSGELTKLPITAEEMARVNRLVFGNQSIRNDSAEKANEELARAPAELGDIAVAQQVLVSGLLSIIVRETSISDTLADWSKAIKGLVIEAGLKSWLQDGREILLMATEDAVVIAKSEEQPRERRLLAALRMSADKTLDVDSIFYSHVTILVFFSASIVRSTAAEVLVAILARVWPAKMISTFALQSPRLTVPAVLAACESNLGPLQKSAKILLAVQQAIGRRLPKEYQDQLNSIASKSQLL
ncbi:MAG TPA: hypothetical protein VJU77_14555 [Chthoniobacterales bacterium]|nr:hypothetical protein [Chthoniobacterales bacterium]